MVEEARAEAVAAPSPDSCPVRPRVSDPATSRRCSPDDASAAMTDVRVRGTVLILKRTGRRRRYLMHDLVLLYSSAAIAALGLPRHRRDLAAPEEAMASETRHELRAAARR